MNTPLPPGTVLNGKYRIDRVLGSGGFGITYEAFDRLKESQVCIKELIPSGSIRMPDGKVQWTGNAEIPFHRLREYFIKECQRLEAIGSHPSIVKTKDIFEQNDTAYLVMEYIRGLTLGQYVKQSSGQLPVEQSIQLILELAEAVKVVHANQMLHLDIKPENVIVGLDNRIVLIDFGSARDLSRDDQLRNSTFAFVSHGFSAMELYSNSGDRAESTDVYSLGAVFFFLLTGTNPTNAPDRVSNDNLIPKIGSLLMPDSVRSVLVKSLSVVQGNRYRTVAEFASELKEATKEGYWIKVQRWFGAVYDRITSGLGRLSPLQLGLGMAMAMCLIGVLSYAFIKAYENPKITKPVAMAGADQQIEAGKIAGSVLKGNGKDEDGSVNTYRWTQVSGPPVVLTDVQQSELKLPDLDPADYTFALIVTDDQGNASDPDSVRVTVINKPKPRGKNRPPVAKGYTISYSTGGKLTIELQASDPDGDKLSYLVISKPMIGRITGNGKTRVYQTACGKSGTDVIEYRVRDGQYSSNTAQIRIELKSGGMCPIPPMVRTTQEGESVAIFLDGPNGKTFKISRQPTNGSVVSRGGNQVSYTPRNGFSGQDTFGYTVSDGQASVANTVTITVSKKQPAPRPEVSRWIEPEVRSVRGSQVFSMDEWKNAMKDKRPVWCYFNFQQGDPNGYGPYFNLYAVRSSSDVCPSGWHVPTLDEWRDLSNQSDQLNALSRTKAGYLDASGFIEIGVTSCFWVQPSGSGLKLLGTDNMYAEIGGGNVKGVRKKNAGFRVRCKQ